MLLANSHTPKTKIIEYYSSTENDPMDLFWKLFDEYKAEAETASRILRALHGRPPLSLTRV
jgi:hypothetical protein